MKLNITPSGKDLLVRNISGEEGISIVFNSVAFGNGADAGENATALTNSVLETQIASITRDNDFVSLHVTMNNSAIQTRFRVTEVGVFVEDPTDENESILFAYGYTPDTSAQLIPAITDYAMEVDEQVYVYVGTAADVSAVLGSNLGYVSYDDFNDHIHDYNNPHRVTKAQIGLGNVENIATADISPVYTVPNELSEMTSGEKIGKAFGKIAAAVRALIAHLANRNNPHGITPASINAAASSHTHGLASSSLTGILTVAKGGTGVNSIGTLWSNTLKAMADAEYATIGHTHPYADASHTHSAAHITSGTLAVARGGTGVTSLKTLWTGTLQGYADALYAPLDHTHDFTIGSHKHSAADITSGTLAVARGGTGVASLKTLWTGTLQGYADALYAPTNHTHNYAASSHKHSAADITSGTLAVARGGTGVTSLQTLWTGTLKGYADALYATVNHTHNYASPSHTHAVGDITGILPVAKGGTGVNSLRTLWDNTLKGYADSVYAPKAHEHKAADITSGTLAIARGGTGVTSIKTLWDNTLQGYADALYAAKNHAHTLEDLGGSLGYYVRTTDYDKVTSGRTVTRTCAITTDLSLAGYNGFMVTYYKASNLAKLKVEIQGIKSGSTTTSTLSFSEVWGAHAYYRNGMSSITKITFIGTYDIPSGLTDEQVNSNQTNFTAGITLRCLKSA